MSVRMMMTVPILFVLLLGGCGGGDTAVPPDQNRGDIGIGEPKTGTSLRFETMAAGTHSGITSPRNVVIKDQAGWEQLWKEHMSVRLPPPPVPAVDFGSKMVVGVFLGWSKLGCGGMGIAAIRSLEGKIVVDVEERLAPPGIACTAEAKAHMHLAVVERSDAPVEFASRTVQWVWSPALYTTAYALVPQERQVVVKDEATWARQWEETVGTQVPRPAVDFGKQMVIGAFLGTRPDSCYGSSVGPVVLDGGKLVVRHVETLPPAGAACLTVLTSPGQWVTVERSELPVQFVKDYVRVPLSN